MRRVVIFHEMTLNPRDSGVRVAALLKLSEVLLPTSRGIHIALHRAESTTRGWSTRIAKFARSPRLSIGITRTLCWCGTLILQPFRTRAFGTRTAAMNNKSKKSTQTPTPTNPHFTVESALATVKAAERRNDGSSPQDRINDVMASLPERGPDDLIVRCHVRLADIHQRKTAGENLRQEEQELRRLTEANPGLIAVMTAEGSVEFVNQAVQQYFGRTLQDLKDWTITDTVHPDDLPSVVDAWSRSFESGEPYYMDHRCRRFDGEYRWFHAAGLPLRDDAGRIFRWYVLLTDIQERKAAEEKLREDENELSRIRDAIPNMIVVFRPDGTILHLNKSVLDYSGLPSEDMRREGVVGRFLHPEDIERTEEQRLKASTEPIPFENEMRILGKDGRYRWFLVRYNPLVNDEGRLVRWYATGTDIETRRQAEDGTRNKNPALPEEVNRSSVVEVTAGTSTPQEAVQLSNCDALLDGLRSGHQQAYEELVREFSGRLLNTARCYLRSEADACDAVQNAFLCAFKSIDRFNGDSQLSTWLHRIVVNCALMHLRARRRRGEMDKVDIDDLLPRFDTTGNWVEHSLLSPSAYLSLEASETRTMVRQCIDLLPVNYRTVLMLRDIDELDTEEAAKLMGLKANAVKVRLHRARQALKVLLERHIDFGTK